MAGCLRMPRARLLRAPNGQDGQSHENRIVVDTPAGRAARVAFSNRTRTVTTPPEPITPGILRRLLRQQLYLAALLAIVIWFIFRVRDILPIFLFSFLLAYLLGPLVRRVAGREGKGLSRGVAALLVYLLVIAVLGLALYILYHALQSDVASYARHYQTYRAALLADLRQQEVSGPLRVLPG